MAPSRNALSWKTYPVSAASKAPLLRFFADGLEAAGCRVISLTPAAEAPFYVTLETPLGERIGVLAYLFLANARTTKNRPADEHRFQVKYGADLGGVLDVATDPHQLVVTVFMGVDPDRRFFVAADPVMNAPSPMSRSIEFKDEHVDRIEAQGWHVWERERHLPKTRNRATPPFDEDTRIQVLVGGKASRIFDLVMLERVALGLDPGERHLIAEKLSHGLHALAKPQHALLRELGVDENGLLDLIAHTSSLKMAVRGWVAEQHLENALRRIDGITECLRIETKGAADLTLRWKGGPPILVQCKNVLRKTTTAGAARLDFQRTRAAKANPCSRYYARDEFSLLAACLHAVREEWTFSFALMRDLPAHTTCPGRVANGLTVQKPVFTESIVDALNALQKGP